MDFCSYCGEKLKDTDRFCPGCGRQIWIEAPNHTKNNDVPLYNEIPNVNKKKNEQSGKVAKCPCCGAIIPSFTAVCPDCGYELNTGQISFSIKEFSEKINTYDRQIAIGEQTGHYQEPEGGWSSWSTLIKILWVFLNICTYCVPLIIYLIVRALSPKKKIEVTTAEASKEAFINNYVFPNEKESILDALLFIRTQVQRLQTPSYNEKKSHWIRIWQRKATELHQQAELLFPNDAMENKIYSQICPVVEEKPEPENISEYAPGYTPEAAIKLDSVNPNEPNNKNLIIIGVIVILIIFLFATSAVSNQNKDTQEDSTNIENIQVDEEVTKLEDDSSVETSDVAVAVDTDNTESNFIEGFNEADFSKYSNPDTTRDNVPLYVEGKTIKIYTFESNGKNFYSIAIEDSNNNTWLGILNNVDLVEESYYDDLMNDNVILCGYFITNNNENNFPVLVLQKVRDNDTTKIKKAYLLEDISADLKSN